MNDKKQATLFEPRKPQIAKHDLTIPPQEGIDDDALFENFLIQDTDYSSSNAVDARFLSGTIEHSHFDGSKLKQVKLADVYAKNSYFSNADWEKSLLSRVSIENSKLTGFRNIQGKWTDVLIKESKADLSLFILSKFKNVVFEDCILTDADFQECEMENVRFYKCDLANVAFQGAKLKNVDLRGSKIETIKISPDQFKGLVIEPLQASYLIGATGAIVKWLNEEDGS